MERYIYVEEKQVVQENILQPTSIKVQCPSTSASNKCSLYNRRMQAENIKLQLQQQQRTEQIIKTRWQNGYPKSRQKYV